MNVICVMALTSAQLDEHTNHLYVVVTFFVRVPEAHDISLIFRNNYPQSSFVHSF